MQQVADFKNGLRRSTISDTLPHTGMVASILPTTDAEMKEAYGYFAKNKLTMQRYKVVEATMVPKTKVQGSWVLARRRSSSFRSGCSRRSTARAWSRLVSG